MTKERESYDRLKFHRYCFSHAGIVFLSIKFYPALEFVYFLFANVPFDIISFRNIFYFHFYCPNCISREQ